MPHEFGSVYRGSTAELSVNLDAVDFETVHGNLYTFGLGSSQKIDGNPAGSPSFSVAQSTAHGPDRATFPDLGISQITARIGQGGTRWHSGGAQAAQFLRWPWRPLYFFPGRCLLRPLMPAKQSGPCHPFRHSEASTVGAPALMRGARLSSRAAGLQRLFYGFSRGPCSIPSAALKQRTRLRRLLQPGLNQSLD
jgi:hypothetical protein